MGVSIMTMINYTSMAYERQVNYWQKMDGTGKKAVALISRGASGSTGHPPQWGARSAAHRSALDTSQKVI